MRLLLLRILLLLVVLLLLLVVLLLLLLLRRLQPFQRLFEVLGCLLLLCQCLAKQPVFALQIGLRLAHARRRHLDFTRRLAIALRHFLRLLASLWRLFRLRAHLFALFRYRSRELRCRQFVHALPIDDGGQFQRLLVPGERRNVGRRIQCRHLLAQ